MFTFHFERQFNYKKSGLGFTFIELLVVIAIIALLAAILFPAFGRARENARRTTCQSNLKQIGLGVMQYLQDYDECYPLAIYGSANDGTGWAVSVQPYLKSLGVYQCPSDRTDPSNNKSLEGYTDYWYNAALSWNGSTGTPSYKKAIKSSALLFPSLTIMNGDGTGGSDHSRGSYRMNGCLNGGGYGPSYSENDPAYYSCTATGVVTANGSGNSVNKHFQGHNLCFADGHVKWYQGLRATSNAVASTLMYDITTGFTKSKQSPTFNAVNQNDVP